MQKCNAALVSYIVAALSLLLLTPVAAIADDNLTYSQLRNLIKTGKASQIRKVVVTNGKSNIAVQLAESDKLQTVTVPTELKQRLLENLDDAGITLSVNDEDQSRFLFSMFASFFMPILLLIGFMFMFRARSLSTPHRYKFEPDIKTD